MAIYDKPAHQLMREMASQLLPDATSVVDRDSVRAWFRSNYPKLKVGTVDAHLVKMSTNAPNRFHFSANASHDLLYRIDSKNFRLYNSGTDPSPIYESKGNSDDESEHFAREEALGESETVHESSYGSEFAYERDLRNYLSKNLGKLEPGLKLYEEEGITGVEFPVGGRFIDILGVDSTGALVVIELKVSRGYDRVIGQLLRYMGWIRQNLAEDSQAVRGLIVAKEITSDLKIACMEARNIELFEYELSLTLTRIQ
jgi:endonuclease